MSDYPQWKWTFIVCLVWKLLILYFKMEFKLRLQMSWAARELLEFDLSRSSIQLNYYRARVVESRLSSFSSQVRVARYSARKLISLFEFTYIFNKIIFIYNIYINIYIINRLKFEFEFEYSSVDFRVESSWSRVLLIFHLAELKLEILRLGRSWAKFRDQIFSVE